MPKNCRFPENSELGNNVLQNVPASKVTCEVHSEQDEEESVLEEKVEEKSYRRVVGKVLDGRHERERPQSKRDLKIVITFELEARN